MYSLASAVFPQKGQGSSGGMSMGNSFVCWVAARPGLEPGTSSLTVKRLLPTELSSNIGGLTTLLADRSGLQSFQRTKKCFAYYNLISLALQQGSQAKSTYLECTDKIDLTPAPQ